jgi:hypothetical protein
MMYNVYHAQNYHYSRHCPGSSHLLPSFYDSYSPVNYGSMRSLPQMYHGGSQSTMSCQNKRRSTKSLVYEEHQTPPCLKKKLVQLDAPHYSYGQ